MPQAIPIETQIRSLREELKGLSVVNESMRRTEMAVEAKLGQAERELNDLRQVKGYLQGEINRKLEVLRLLEAEHLAQQMK